MDLEYFSCQIDDELNGAIDYAKKAMEIKPMSPPWTPILIEMAQAELQHATNLYKMAQEYYSKLSSVYTNNMPTCLADLYSEMTDNYAEKSAKAKVMLAMFN